MSTDKRHQRMLEELLAVPGNDVCADCRAMAPRWASVNLGIFLCVNCASVHRKMGTHRSRVKSVTLDSWTRDQITSIKSIGNKASNQIWNPNEALHPPPTSLGAEERDSEIEKYIRRKYEQGAFRADRRGPPTRAAPTSLNRAREADGRLPSGSVTSLGTLSENRRNPELNDIVAKKPVWGAQSTAERDLPPLPVGGSGAPPRLRPVRSGSGTTSTTGASSVAGGAQATTSAAMPSSQMQSQPSAQGSFGNLVDVNGAVSSTLPLQVNVNGYNPFHQQQQQAQQYPQSTPMPSTSAFSTSPSPSYNAFSASPNQFGLSPNQFATSPGQFATSPGQYAMQTSGAGGMLQSPSASYGLSSSAPHGNMLASFDPLHPASQQQQQQQHTFQQQHFGGMAGSFSPQNGYVQMQQGSYQQQGGYLSPGGQMGYMGTSPQGVMGMGGYQQAGGQWMR